MSLRDRMLDAITTAYRRKPDGNIGKLFAIFADSVSEVQDSLERVRLWRGIDDAQGSTLDRIGLNFGVRRDGSEDGFYRLLIKVKVAALLSGGDINTVIWVLVSIFDIKPEAISLAEVFPAKIRAGVPLDAYIRSIDVASCARYMELIKRVIAAGVGFDLGVHNTLPAPLYVAGRCSGYATVQTHIPEMPPMEASVFATGALSVFATTETLPQEED